VNLTIDDFLTQSEFGFKNTQTGNPGNSAAFLGAYKIRPEIFGEEVSKGGADYFCESGEEKFLKVSDAIAEKLI
jgi:hypothetical protein